MPIHNQEKVGISLEYQAHNILMGLADNAVTRHKSVKIGQIIYL